MRIRRKLAMVIETQTRQFVAPKSNGVLESNCAPKSHLHREARWCPACAAVVVMVTPENGTAVARVSARAIYRLVESGKVHFAETQEGALLVCLGSLADHEATDTPEI